jgi:hypothetical protein
VIQRFGLRMKRRDNHAFLVFHPFPDGSLSQPRASCAAVLTGWTAAAYMGGGYWNWNSNESFPIKKKTND